MTIASMFLALMIVTSAADAPGVDPVLLDFQATWCGPCREMRPEVEKLARANYPIQQVDIDRSPKLAERYNVKAVPTFIVADRDGRVLARTEGKMPAGQLAKFFNDAVTQAGANAPPAGPVEADSISTRDPEAEPAAGREPTEEAPAANPRPWETVVRIKMHLTSAEWGFGSGTIIYSDAEESIILTCAHIFKGRDDRFVPVRNFRTPIAVDLFGKDFIPGRKDSTLQCTQKDIPGEAIDYDPVNDVGLIRIRPGRRLAASRVVRETWEPRKGTKMITMGCSHGNDATAWSTQIIEPMIKMKTPDNKSFYEMQCTNAPKQGRSGGGIYTLDGYVAGVCDFADPNGNVGLYATPRAIYKLLDRAQLTALYKPSAGGSDSMLAAANRKGTLARLQSPSDEARPTETSNFTIPTPDDLKIAIPEAKVASNTSRPAPRWNSDSEEHARSNRANRRPERDPGDAVDPGPRVGQALPAEIAGRPNSDVTPAPEVEPRDDAPAPPRRPSSSKWKPVRNGGRPVAN